MARKSSLLLSICLAVFSSAGSRGTPIPVTDLSFALPVKDKTADRIYSKELQRILMERKATTFLLGRSKQGKKIEAYFFQGSSNMRALIIGGVHGSELSSIEVARQLLQQLASGDNIYYSVIIIPSLFPDNAATAKRFPLRIGDVTNTGRYSCPGAVDPNRQMPSPGYSYNEEESLDHAGRKIEIENILLLDLVDQFRPHRIVNLHAIRDISRAGVFADPRTDHYSIALGYETDSSLAVNIAKYIQQNGGYIPGNSLTKRPTALYYKDPDPAPAGHFQKRNFSGSFLPGQRGGGISLGTWASTAIMNEQYPSKNREAIRILTMEFPGSKRPVDYSSKNVQAFYQQQIEVYAAALKNIFLGDYFIEEK